MPCTLTYCTDFAVRSRAKDDLSLENVNESLSNALVLRSSRVSEESNFSNQDLDAVVSAKIFHDIGDGLAKVGNTLKAVGMKAGEAAGNAAMVASGLRPGSKS